MQADLDLLDEPGLLALAGRDREGRHQVRPVDELDVAALGDQQRVVARLGQLGPHRAHLRGGLHVEVAGIEAEALRVVHGRARADAQQDVVGVGGVGVHVVQVVRRDQREVEAAGDPQQVVAEPALDRAGRGP